MVNTIRWEYGDDGVVLLTLDHPGRSANVMNAEFGASLTATVDRLEAERGQIAGVIVTSAKKTFFAGGDLDALLRLTPADAEASEADTRLLKNTVRRLETLGRPVVAAINGSALGGGLELALGCHHRIVLDDPAIEIGFPEVTLGLLPGCGGVVRTVRLLGVADALVNWLLRGQRRRPQDALAHGLVDEIATDEAGMMDAARAWIAANPDAAQPSDRESYRIPGGTPSSPALAGQLPAMPAMLRKQLKGAPYPAPVNILAAAVEGAQVDLDTAFTIEGRYFTELATGQIAKNMIKALFFDVQTANSRDIGDGHPPLERVAVIGAGMMGAAIAYVCARAGMQVVLKDVTVEGALRGKAYSAGLLDKAVARGVSTPDQRDAILARIQATGDLADLAGVDLAIEAVFEDPALKHKVYAEIEQVAPGALIASNTSTLPITMLAEGVSTPEEFIGLHFFSPVDKMPLVEVIRGARTDEATLRRALGVVRRLRKTPIVVNDSRGFFTSRVIGTFTNEGVAMLAEGIPAATIEQASSQAGYPAPVLALMDELTLTLPRKIRQETAAATVAAGGTWQPHAADAVIDRMIDDCGRPGRSGGAGFYDYRDGKRVGLWPGLRDTFGGTNLDTPFEDLKERMLFIEAIESVRCLEEGVLVSVVDANVGSILGIGYPSWTGGVLQYINQYEGGLPGFVARARVLAERYGDRFDPPPLLVAMADRGERFE
ncbi:3-hydroxyacyl-CoA dehydrogenase [Micromonospora echinospora]|uniref:3-hydroxyacyl-CoA dehydrogenase / enoyl-CoA hydratase / 3-hydroxybutyryl-CoA epimerase n=1 Tax=Micromonospora echinospora TaxID=1877 RepID=A0A1C4ZK19_MICEC|nr:3-hydroxyacyl-CoA dehydrogenase NAD-binding domain-containing protein [Micromonospora echinospora]OZV81508.1 3-hydroxyacyl-CoA dehydrogenase [Micromonospora echinospora]SCF33427.1 3-hydroxyacyl-CoA dehydrogenase / enoyl-CoA hydratase / 3-hydroxybutyryl-CoA epimerase [Micromonospora echinospora]